MAKPIHIAWLRKSPRSGFAISNGSCATAYLCTGTAGYDGPTGNGTPNGAGAF